MALENRKDRIGPTWLWAALTGSLLIHTLLLLLPGLRSERAEPPRGIEIALQERLPADLPVPHPLPDPAPEPAPESVPLEPERIEQPEPIASPEPVRQIAVESPGPEPRPAPPEPSAEAIRHQIITSIRREHQPEARDRTGPYQPATVPRLPDAPGWINQYVGPVSASVDHWQENDGSRSTRIVTSSGQVYCGRARPPTMAELFNPQFATNIMLFRSCGRERPAPADPEDPWLRGPRGDG